MNEINNFKNILEKSAELNFKRWTILGSYIWPNAPGFNDRKTYESEVDYFIEWLSNRYIWLDGAIQAL